MALTDPLDDDPSLYHLRRVVAEKRAQVAEGQALMGPVPEEWAACLMWAAEVPLMLAWELHAMPWQFYLEIWRGSIRLSRTALPGRKGARPPWLRSGVDMDYSCQQGTCRTCLALVVRGNVVMDDDPSLAIGPKEMARGYRLLCVSVPSSAEVEIDV